MFLYHAASILGVSHTYMIINSFIISHGPEAPLFPIKEKVVKDSSIN